MKERSVEDRIVELRAAFDTGDFDAVVKAAGKIEFEAHLIGMQLGKEHEREWGKK